MSAGFHWEPMIATGYALLLVVVAGALEWMGRHSSKRGGRYHLGGFRFQKEQDNWECPAGARLMRAEVDNELRVIRYRAPAHTCNGCAVKAHCTDSDHGREIEIPLDPWLSTEIGRFHRGMSLALLLLAALITAVEFLRHDHGTERWVLAGVLVAIAGLAMNAAQGLSLRDRT